MNIGLRGKLFATSFILMAIVGGASGLFLEHQLREWVVSRTESAVLTHAESVRVALETAAPEATIPATDAVAERMGQATGARITVIDRRGRVLGDSSLSVEGVREVENHADRPEVRAALERGRGTSRRLSDTVEREMLYLAVPYETAASEGVVRASLPLEALGASVRRLRWYLGGAGLVGLVVAVAMSGLASHLAARNIRALVSRAEDRARSTPSPGGVAPAPDDPPAPSSSSIGEMAGRLEQTVDDLARQRDRMEAILESMSDAVLVVDDGRRIELVNSAAADLFRLTEDPTGRPLGDLVDQPAVDELYEKASGGGRPSVELEYERDGETHHLIARAAREPSTHSVVIVIHDVTELRRLERVRRDFVANISHELRTPVSIIRANAETLQDGALEDPEHAPQFLDSILRTIERMSDLVDDLLDISRLEAGRYGIEPAPVQVRPVVDQTLVDVAAGLDDDLGLSNDVDEDLWVVADRQALHQVLLNLVDNAAKYTDEGRIWVRSKRDDDTAVVEVHDTGRGVPEEDRDRVFERFYRVDSGRSRDEGGTGLGLSVVKHLVENMDGEIGYRPGKVQGSIFWFRLPLASRDPDV